MGMAPHAMHRAMPGILSSVSAGGVSAGSVGASGMSWRGMEGHVAVMVGGVTVQRNLVVAVQVKAMRIGAVMGMSGVPAMSAESAQKPHQKQPAKAERQTKSEKIHAVRLWCASDKSRCGSKRDIAKIREPKGD